MIKLFGTWQFGKIDVFVNFIIQKLKFCKIEKEGTLIKVLSALDRSRDSTAKRNLSKDM